MFIGNWDVKNIEFHMSQTDRNVIFLKKNTHLLRWDDTENNSQTLRHFYEHRVKYTHCVAYF